MISLALFFGSVVPVPPLVDVSSVDVSEVVVDVLDSVEVLLAELLLVAALLLELLPALLLLELLLLPPESPPLFLLLPHPAILPATPAPTMAK